MRGWTDVIDDRIDDERWIEKLYGNLTDFQWSVFILRTMGYTMIDAAEHLDVSLGDTKTACAQIGRIGKNMSKCPVCKIRNLVQAAGPEDSPILLIGPYPGKKEKDMGTPWVGPAGKALRRELARVGIVMGDCRVTNMWMHDAMWKNSDEADFHVHEAFIEMKHPARKAMLLMGADAVRYVMHRSVTEISGLRIRGGKVPHNIDVAVACYNPASMLKGGIVGEVRLAIERFAELTEDYR